MTDQTGFYPVDAIAALLNLKRRRVQQLARQGIIPKAEQGRYNLSESIAGYVRYLQDQIERDAPSDLDQHRLRLLDARAHKLEQENDQREAGLIPLEEARLALEMVIDAFAAGNKALLRRRLIDELVGIAEPALIRFRLKEAVRAIRQDAADQLNALAKQGQKARRAH